MKRSAANPAMERSKGPKATVMARVLVRWTWTGVRDWASSQRGKIGEHLSLWEISCNSLSWWQEQEVQIYNWLLAHKIWLKFSNINHQLSKFKMWWFEAQQSYYLLFSSYGFTVFQELSRRPCGLKSNLNWLAFHTVLETKCYKIWPWRNVYE